MSAVATSLGAGGTWQLHPTFDGEVTHVITTPHYIYFSSRALPKDNPLTGNYISLFRFDREGEEVQGVSADNLLSSSPLYEVIRNPRKKYIMTVGSDYSIDFIHDDGTTSSIPSYRNATLASAKTVSSLTPDPARDRVYMSTAFGYVELNDKKYEIADSRNYGEVIVSVARLGNQMLLLRTTGLHVAPLENARFTLTDYKKVTDLLVPIGLYPVDENRCVLLTNGGAPHLLYILSLDENGEIVMGEPYVGNFFSPEYNDEGLCLRTGDAIMQIGAKGEPRFANVPSDETNATVGTDDFVTFWFGDARKGLREMKLSQENGWSLQRDYMLPDAPSPFISACMAQHPTEGFLVENFGRTVKFYNYNIQSPLLLSSYSGGRWVNLSAAYTAPEQPAVITNPYGFAIDPDNPDYIYASGMQSGLARLNIKDPTDIIHFVNPSHEAASQPGYVPLVDDISYHNNWSCSFSAPRFDSYGNLWTIHANFDQRNPPRTSLYCWEAADRRATVSPTEIRLPKLLYIDGISPTHNQTILPLLTKKNRNLLVYADMNYAPGLTVIDTGGTPTDQSDDKIASFSSYYDQDGNSVDINSLRVLYEDPSTGYVWGGCSSGVFYFDPMTVFTSSPRITKVKVARNDGTNLADYLLNGVEVADIISDGAGRKWFATIGAGVVCTSADGRTILEEYTKDNSPLPDDEVVKLGYVKENNSLMISTMKGLVEYRMNTAAGDDGSKEEVKVYPNPIRPDYYGYVTIEGLREGSLVKIVDSGGNMVKELGPIDGTSAQWDTTNLNFKKVSSGVYFILSSSSGEETWSNVGKLLIVN